MSILDGNQGGGDKRTVIAVILSVVVITIGFTLQGIFFPPPKQAAPAPQPTESATAAPGSQSPTATPAASPGAAAETIVAAPAPGATATSAPAAAAPAKVQAPLTAPAATTGTESVPLSEQTYTVSTNLIDAVFTNRGGDLISLKLKKHRDKSGAVDLMVPDSQGARGLSVSFGGPSSAPLADLMNVRMLDPKTIEFSRTYLATVPGNPNPVPFSFRKTFTFRDGEYLFGMAVSLKNTVNEYLPLDQGGVAYTVSFGPQIGPRLDESARKANSDYRRFISLVDGKKRQEKLKEGVPLTVKDQPSWIALSGKYFTFITVPELNSFGATLTTAPDSGIVQSDRIAITRPAIRASEQTDAYYFYFGPKTSSELAKYNYADRNTFQKSDLKLDEAMDGAGMLTWLENILKVALNLFYQIIPNYGVAIILVTILVKAILFPLTRKGSVSASRMQELQPKMQEIQAKYKGNPQKLNQELAEFYKREGYNPMSGCLPLLIQFPIFIAMYNLFNNHFDLRGAMFIPGWIPDLSQPEAIFSFPTINLVIWHLSALRLLPIIYLASQLLYGKYTQMMSAGGQSAAQMKIMMYGMPIMFFFILYDVPSGLLIYWIVSNVLSIVQQIAINDILRKRKAAAAVAAAAVRDSRPKIAPMRKK
ncbi:MAG TPA: membrane protein insertase YidC [Rectinemataceae bacterium]|nr:membrane protein insertase YidC [Rectinemataceae bacterium]